MTVNHRTTTTLSPTEIERLIKLFPFPRASKADTLGAEARAALMVNNTPAVARRWLAEEGLLDESEGEAE